ncbi:uncharacterized protein METZ01_LOCUS429763, partial [marine metagenome]
HEGNDKIAIFLDDFQHILGQNTDEIFKSISLGKKPTIPSNGSEIIAENLKQITDSLSTKFLFIVASYPINVIERYFEKQFYPLKRNFHSIEVDKYEYSSETKELITGPLNDLPDDHPLKKYTNYDPSINIDIETELDRLAERVHSDSNGMPYDIKKEMELVYNYFEDNKSKDKKLNDVFKTASNALEIYRKLIPVDSEHSDHHKKIENYSLERKYHLQLLTNLSTFTLDEIVEFHILEIAFVNIIEHYNYNNKSLDNFNPKNLSNR